MISNIQVSILLYLHELNTHAALLLPFFTSRCFHPLLPSFQFSLLILIRFQILIESHVFKASLIPVLLPLCFFTFGQTHIQFIRIRFFSFSDTCP
jgi:hypothetical protein